MKNYEQQHEENNHPPVVGICIVLLMITVTGLSYYLYWSRNQAYFNSVMASPSQLTHTVMIEVGGPMWEQGIKELFGITPAAKIWHYFLAPYVAPSIMALALNLIAVIAATLITEKVLGHTKVFLAAVVAPLMASGITNALRPVIDTRVYYGPSVMVFALAGLWLTQGLYTGYKRYNFQSFKVMFYTSNVALVVFALLVDVVLPTNKLLTNILSLVFGLLIGILGFGVYVVRHRDAEKPVDEEHGAEFDEGV